MDDHVLAVHLKRKPYGCSECSYRSAQRSHLRRHQRDVGHSGDIMLPGTATGYGSGASSAAGPAYVGGDGGGGMASTPGGDGVGGLGGGGGGALGSGGPARGAYGGGGLGDGGSSSRPAGVPGMPAYAAHLGGLARGAYYALAHPQRRAGDDEAADRQAGGEDIYSGSDGQDGGGTETEEDMPPSGAMRGGPAGR